MSKSDNCLDKPVYVYYFVRCHIWLLVSAETNAGAPNGQPTLHVLGFDVRPFSAAGTVWKVSATIKVRCNAAEEGVVFP